MRERKGGCRVVVQGKVAVSADMVRRANPGGKKEGYFWIAGCFLKEDSFPLERRYLREAKESRGGDWERDRESLKGKFFWLSEDTKQE